MKKDKKWLIEEINNLYKDYSPSYWNDAVAACFELVDQLDEPQKVVVPRWFDEWVKKNIIAERRTYSRLYELFSDELAMELTREQNDWIELHIEEAIRAILDGYEVEKEKLYWVDLGKSIWMYNYINKTGCIRNTDYFDMVRKDGLMTEAEIKAIDERYWAFAVPVREVEE